MVRGGTKCRGSTKCNYRWCGGGGGGYQVSDMSIKCNYSFIDGAGGTKCRGSTKCNYRWCGGGGGYQVSDMWVNQV